MARPHKTGGIDYFSIDVVWERKVRIFKAKYKLEGVGAFVTLLQEIYKDDGYYLDWNKETQILFCDEHSIDLELINEMIEFAVELSIFNKPMFEKFGVLTSSGIQKRYLRGCSKRSHVELDQKFVCVDKNSIKDVINPIKVTFNRIKGDDNTTKESKVKESKVKESKKEKNTGDKSPDSHSKNKKPTKKNYAPSVNMTEEEHQKLIDKYGPDQTQRMIEKLSNYKEATGKRYKSDYRAILNWVVEALGVTEITDKPDLTERWVKVDVFAGGSIKCECGGPIHHFQQYIGSAPTGKNELRCGKCEKRYNPPPITEDQKRAVKEMKIKSVD